MSTTVGHDGRPGHPLVTFGAGGVLFDDQRVLLVQMNYGSRVGAWTIPGGFGEAGEHPHEALKREMQEEAGIECQVGDLIGVRHRFARLAGSTKTPENIYFVFLCQLIEPVPAGVRSGESLSWDTRELLGARWWDLFDALQAAQVNPATKYFLAQGALLQGLPLPQGNLTVEEPSLATTESFYWARGGLGGSL